jgi:hypothetical protein
MKYLKLFEDYVQPDPFDSELYLDDYLGSDFYDIYEEDIEENPELEKTVYSDINTEIEYVKNLQYPIQVWRGLPKKDVPNLNEYPLYEDELGCWTTDRRIATGFGEVIYEGLILSEDNVDLEQTIRTRVMNPDEKEITVNDSHKVEIVNIEIK